MSGVRKFLKLEFTISFKFAKIFTVADSFEISRATKNIFAEKEIPLILRLLYCCGLRVGETVNIKVGDIDFERNFIILRVTKKYKQRLIPLWKRFV